MPRILMQALGAVPFEGRTLGTGSQFHVDSEARADALVANGDAKRVEKPATGAAAASPAKRGPKPGTKRAPAHSNKMADDTANKTAGDAGAATGG